jgi:hypothetical protein
MHASKPALRVLLAQLKKAPPTSKADERYQTNYHTFTMESVISGKAPPSPPVERHGIEPCYNHSPGSKYGIV